MKDKLEQRLKELKSEFESGQTMLSDLEAQQANLKTTLLRISGAIQVLEELLSADRELTENNDRVLETVGAIAQYD
jgi:predicted nuclease with TOPRIM domain